MCIRDRSSTVFKDTNKNLVKGGLVLLARFFAFCLCAFIFRFEFVDHPTSVGRDSSVKVQEIKNLYSGLSCVVFWVRAGSGWTPHLESPTSAACSYLLECHCLVFILTPLTSGRGWYGRGGCKGLGLVIRAQMCLDPSKAFKVQCHSGFFQWHTEVSGWV